MAAKRARRAARSEARKAARSEAREAKRQERERALEQPEAPHPRAPTSLAPHHLRLFALGVDYMLAVGLLNIGYRLLLGNGWDLRPPPLGALHPVWLVSAAALMLLRDLLLGQSPGKWFAGIAVAKATDPAAIPPLRALLLRNVTLVLLPVEGVLVFTDRYYRRLGDHLAGTVVVTQGRPAPVMRRLMGMAIFFLASTLAIFLVEFWNVRRSVAYPVALKIAREDPGVARTFGKGLELKGPGLSRSADGMRMRVHLDAHGVAGKGSVEVDLRRVGTPPHWELTHVTAKLERPSRRAKPKVQEAPRR